MITRRDRLDYILSHGSITVEAAFVIPIVIFAIFAIIYLSFYLHDICLIQGKLDLVMHKAEMNYKHDTNLNDGSLNYLQYVDQGIFEQYGQRQEVQKKQILENLKKELGKGLFLYHVVSLQVDVGITKVRTTIGADYQVSLPYFSKAFADLTEFKISESVSIHKPAEMIRCSEVILETGSDIKGIKELKEKLEAFNQ